MDKATLERELEEARARIRSLPEVADKGRIEYTATTLTTWGFSPPVIYAPDDFVHADRAAVLATLDRIGAMDETDVPETERADAAAYLARAAGLLVHQFELLTRLRQDKVAAWDEIHELYMED
jgi:hypothetical protein